VVTGTRRDTPIYAGRRTSEGPGFGSLDEALAGAAAVSEGAGRAAQAVVEEGARFVTYELLQPGYTRRSIREDAASMQPVRFRPVGEAGGAARLRFVSLAETGTYTLDPTGTFEPRGELGSAVRAIVSGRTAVVGDELRTVAAGAADVADVGWGARAAIAELLALG
jgi:hypothetical protein